MTKKILIISLLLYCTSLLAQDTLFQCDFSVNPIRFDKIYDGFGTETSYKTSRNIIPSLTFSLPIHNKFSFTIGSKIYQGTYEGYFNDSTRKIIDPVDPELFERRGYIYYNKLSRTNFSILASLNYNLYYNKIISTNISVGIEAAIWEKYYQYYEFYPISMTNNSQKTKKHFNSPLDESIYSPCFNATLKYFPLRHFGILIRPNISYSFYDDAIISCLGIGICYK